ncbi:hypothetical protein MD484_g8614, partial [Candolleomyces efflorescens]
MPFIQFWSMVPTYITSCPSGVVPEDVYFPPGLFNYPPLTLPSDVQPGSEICLSFNNSLVSLGSDESQSLYAVFSAGKETLFAPLTPGLSGDTPNSLVTKTVSVPDSLQEKGAVYVVIIQTTPDDLLVTDTNTVAGPGMVKFLPIDPGPSSAKAHGESAGLVQGVTGTNALLDRQ